MWRIVWKNLLLIILGTVAVVYVYQTYIQAKPCSTPIEFRIGTLDPRFGVSQSAFIDDINEASTIWDNAIGKNLFVYNPNGSLVINLVYDTRQQTTQQETTLKSNITQTSETAASAKQQYQKMQVEYAQANQKYTSDLAQFTQAQNAYNTQVAYWNAQGGAPAAEFATLKATKASLATQQQSLDTERQQVNSLATQTNALIDKYNSLVNNINSTVHSINTDGLAGTQFEEGVYVSGPSGQHIDIYQFDTRAAFIRVIAHELGHALGLQHNSDPNSIMNPVNDSTSMVASPEDLAELKMACDIQ